MFGGAHRGNEDKVIDFLTDPKNFLVLLGDPGCGKTYFCAALMDWATQNFRFPTIKRLTESDLFEKLREVEAWDFAGRLRSLMDADLFIYDDLGSIGQTSGNWRKEVISTMISSRYESLGYKKIRPMIIISNYTQKELENIYDVRTTDRLFSTENTIIDLFGIESKRKTGI